MDADTVAELRGLAVSSGAARAPRKAQFPVNTGVARASHKKQTQAGVVVVVFVVSCAMLHMFVSRPQHKHSVDHLPASGGGRHAVQQLVFMCTFVDIAVDGLCGL